ncbi:hypothetical protein POM88_006538 [Heracleum sosnowskyi]|uniref:Carboxypeptidase n=1 Tax=Heracleum sosnowskyi TaxID=360622 RepID=A0AAD8N033_9APIA|nr:hypothetical protein POM88_006538 [Heracleum sosnowskyi]
MSVLAQRGFFESAFGTEISSRDPYEEDGAGKEVHVLVEKNTADYVIEILRLSVLSILQLVQLFFTFASNFNFNWQHDSEKVDVCVEEETVVYLNQKDVQKALHARLVGVTKWVTCSSVLHYDMENLEVPTINILGSLVKSGIHVLVYIGDQDSVLPLTGTRVLVDILAKELNLNTTVPYSSWIT